MKKSWRADAMQGCFSSEGGKVPIWRNENIENILEIKKLNKKYDQFELKDMSFSLPKGYIMGFVGQNGSGKNTTIRSILNMAKFDSGKISVFGLDSVKDTIAIKERIGVVFDSLYLVEHLNAKQIEQQLKSFYKDWDSKEVEKAAPQNFLQCCLNDLFSSLIIYS